MAKHGSIFISFLLTYVCLSLFRCKFVGCIKICLWFGMCVIMIEKCLLFVVVVHASSKFLSIFLCCSMCVFKRFQFFYLCIFSITTQNELIPERPSNFFFRCIAFQCRYEQDVVIKSSILIVFKK